MITVLIIAAIIFVVIFGLLMFAWVPLVYALRKNPDLKFYHKLISKEKIPEFGGDRYSDNFLLFKLKNGAEVRYTYKTDRRNKKDIVTSFSISAKGPKARFRDVASSSGMAKRIKDSISYDILYHLKHREKTAAKRALIRRVALADAIKDGDHYETFYRGDDLSKIEGTQYRDDDGVLVVFTEPEYAKFLLIRD